MVSKRLSLKILLVFSLLAPLQLGSFAYAESSDVLTKGQLVRPGGGGYPRVTFCPPNMAAAGITMQTNILSSGLLLDLRIECIDQGMLDKGVNSYSPYTKFYGGVERADIPVRTLLCPEGSLLVGLRMSTSLYIRDMFPVCGNAENGQITLDSKVGSALGEPLTNASICPSISGQPTFVVGLDGFSGAGVDAVQVLCGRTLKSNSKISLPSKPVLLAQYLPRGPTGTNHYLQAESLNPFVNFSSLNQLGGDGTDNTSVFPFKTSTVSGLDGNHYFYFTVTPTSSNLSVKITQVTYASRSYAIGEGPANRKITGNSANRMFFWVKNTDSRASIPISPTNDSKLLSLSGEDLSMIPVVKKGTEFNVGFVGATGYQYNDLSGVGGATGMMIYGQLIDNSVKVPESPVVSKLADGPVKLDFLLVKNTALVTVDLPASVKSSLDQLKFVLLSKELGFVGEKKLFGTLYKGKASFKFKMDDIHFGKTVSFESYIIRDSLYSAPFVAKLKIPAQSKTTATAKPTATPKTTPKAFPPKELTVKCSKAGQTRMFKAASCPPGYKRQ